jgi:hypothetical protein
MWPTTCLSSEQQVLMMIAQQEQQQQVILSHGGNGYLTQLNGAVAQHPIVPLNSTKHGGPPSTAQAATNHGTLSFRTSGGAAKDIVLAPMPLPLTVTPIGIPSTPVLAFKSMVAAQPQTLPVTPSVAASSRLAHDGGRTALCSLYIKGLPRGDCFSGSGREISMCLRMPLQSLLLAHLLTDASELDLYCIFAPHGAIISCRVPVDEHTGSCHGVGFVNFKRESDAHAALATVHGTRPARLHSGTNKLSVTLQACGYLGSCSNSSRKGSGLTPTAVFALATPKSPIGRGGRWQLQLYLYIAIFFFYFSVILSDTHQGRVWNQATQPELVAKPWQRRELNPRPLGVVGKFRDLHQPWCLP